MALAVAPIPRDTYPAWQCKAHSPRTGKRCRQKAIRGASVCKMHGGSAPQVRAAAQARILALVNPALNAVADCLEVDQPLVIRLAAARDILDRAGFSPRQQHELAGDVTFTLRIDRGSSSDPLED